MVVNFCFSLYDTRLILFQFFSIFWYGKFFFCINFYCVKNIHLNYILKRILTNIFYIFYLLLSDYSRSYFRDLKFKGIIHPEVVNCSDPEKISNLFPYFKVLHGNTVYFYLSAILCLIL